MKGIGISIIVLLTLCASLKIAAQDFTALGIKNTGQKLEALALNSKAPGFSGIDQNGDLLKLSSLLKKGPVVLIFYRGEWCPVCNRYLQEFQTGLESLKAAGASVVAVTPEQEQYRDSSIEKSDISFPVIIDSDQSIMNDYKVAFEVTEDYQSKIRSYLNADIAQQNAQEQAVLPVPATYIISQEGIIVWSQYDPDYKNRASIEDIQDALTQL